MKTKNRVGCYLLTSAILLSCNNERKKEQPQHFPPRAPDTTVPTPASSAANKPEELPPLSGYPWYMKLDEARGQQDIITLPIGASERRPILVAVHGGGDRPEWACGIWRIAVESYAFVVCPVGLSTGSARYAWGTDRDIAAAVERALSQTRRLFSNYVDSGPMIYAGFSQGATLAGDYLVSRAAQFPIAVLAEGGYDYIATGAFASRYYAAGGRRLLLLCGTPGCTVTANRASAVLRRAGLQVTVLSDMTSGHGIGERLRREVRNQWEQLVDGMEGWQSFSRNRWPKEW